MSQHLQGEQMESLSKEKNLISGLLLGMAIAIAIPYAQPSELRASAQEVPVSEQMIKKAIQDCLGAARLQGGTNPNGIIDMVLFPNTSSCPR